MKVPKVITHQKRLVSCETVLERFLDETSGLREKLGPLLVQLPPSFAWNGQPVGLFFGMLRARHHGPVVIEPRHVSWFENEPSAQLSEFNVGRVVADPSMVLNFHPRRLDAAELFPLARFTPIYYSSYSDNTLVNGQGIGRVRRKVRGRVVQFDNTAENTAIQNALTLVRLLNATVRSRLSPGSAAKRVALLEYDVPETFWRSSWRARYRAIDSRIALVDMADIKSEQNGFVRVEHR